MATAKVLLIPRAYPKARDLDGIDQRFSITKIDAIGTNNFFFDFFVYPIATTSTSYIFRNHIGTPTFRGVSFGCTSAQKRIYMFVGDLTQQLGYNFTLNTITFNAWNYVHIEFDRSNLLRCWVNSHDTPDTTTHDISGWSGLNLQSGIGPLNYLGGDSSALGFECRLARFGIGIGSLLTDAERLEVYNSGRGRLTRTLVAGTKAKFTLRWDMHRLGNEAELITGTNTATQVGSDATILTAAGPPN